jgi:hypothetical protein
MMAALENNPKIMAAIKASGISVQEFLVIPSCVQITAGVYNSQAQGRRWAPWYRRRTSRFTSRTRWKSIGW